MSKLAILINTTQQPDTTFEILPISELRRWIRRGIVFKYFLRYSMVCIFVYRLETIPSPLRLVLMLRAFSRGQCLIVDEQGNKRQIKNIDLFLLLARCTKESISRFSLIRKIRNMIGWLEKQDNKENEKYQITLSAPPVYLRTDFNFGIRSGGSLGHIAGVLNNLDSFFGKPIFISSDYIATIRPDITTHVVFPKEIYRDFRELPIFYFNFTFLKKAQTLLEKSSISFIYQRYSLNNFVGLSLSLEYAVPFVLEYNGSEVWINRNWGKPLKYESLSERVELLNLNRAKVIVVVSKAMKEELLERGIGADKILVNPNGVDVERYSSFVDGSAIRNRYKLAGMTVIGFIGTFGKWHGAEVLAEAFGSLLSIYPDYRKNTRLLMIGDGITMPLVKNNLAKFGIEDVCILTGSVAQAEGPRYLASCDILASPHVPNPDGSPFFGSPTKLFEYMAMGKGIVASDLDQIGEVLEHEQTAWLVQPGNAEALMNGLKTMIDDEPLRVRLGKAAYQEAVAKYTWGEHTRKFVEKLKERCK